MIKVNLLKNRSASGGDSASYGVSLERSGKEEQKDILIKVMLIAFFPMVLIFIEKYHMDSLKKEQILYSSQLQEVQDKITKLKEQTAKGADFEKQAKELEDKMKIMKTLSKTRLRELKALDYLQTIMPERVWLVSLDYSEEKFRLRGLTLTDEDLTDLIQSLDKSSFFTNVILLQAKEETTKEGTLKNFEMTTTIEGQE